MKYVTEGVVSFIGEGKKSTVVVKTADNFTMQYADQSNPKKVEQVAYSVLVHDDDTKGGSIRDAVLVLPSQEYAVAVGSTLKRALLLAASRGRHLRLIITMDDAKNPTIVGILQRV